LLPPFFLILILFLEILDEFPEYWAGGWGYKKAGTSTKRQLEGVSGFPNLAANTQGSVTQIQENLREAQYKIIGGGCTSVHFILLSNNKRDSGLLLIYPNPVSSERSCFFNVRSYDKHSEKACQEKFSGIKRATSATSFSSAGSGRIAGGGVDCRSVFLLCVLAETLTTKDEATAENLGGRRFCQNAQASRRPKGIS